MSFPAVAQQSTLEEVVVTARHRDERLQDVPISIAALSADSLAERQIDSTERLSQVAPNVQFSPVAPSSGNSSSSSIFIRGVGQTDFIASTDPGVGFYVDGVYFARASGTAVTVLDVERIEVLRGPQGTLFGRNTVGGAIQIIAKKPSLDEFQGKASVALGRFERRDATVVLNVPVADTFGIRLAAQSRSREGYVRNVLNGQQRMPAVRDSRSTDAGSASARERRSEVSQQSISRTRSVPRRLASTNAFQAGDVWILAHHYLGRC